MSVLLSNILQLVKLEVMFLEPALGDPGPDDGNTLGRVSSRMGKGERGDTVSELGLEPRTSLPEEEETENKYLKQSHLH